jgi:hypothetical protein
MRKCRINVHDEVSVLVKEIALQGLGEEVSMHVYGLTIAKHNVTRVDPVLRKEISQLNVFRPLGTRMTTIICQRDAAFIVLKKHILGDGELLSFQEMFRPLSGMTSWSPTNSLSVELRVTSFCRVGVLYTAPWPMDRTPPVCRPDVPHRKHPPTTSAHRIHRLTE